MFGSERAALRTTFPLSGQRLGICMVLRVDRHARLPRGDLRAHIGDQTASVCLHQAFDAREPGRAFGVTKG